MRLRKKETKMKTEREFFEKLPEIRKIMNENGIYFMNHSGWYEARDFKDFEYEQYINGAWYSWQARVPEDYVVVPKEPTYEMWSELSRHLGRYMQLHDRYCPKTLKKYFDRFIGEPPEWLSKEVSSWDSDHAFATADLPVFIYKAMIEAAEK